MILLTYALGLMQVIYGLILLFLLPGYALTLLLFPKGGIDALERISLALGLSISVCVLAIFTSNYFLGIPVIYGTVATEILCLTVLFILIYLLRRPRGVLKIGLSLNDIKNIQDPRRAILPAFTLLLVLFIAFNLIYGVHQDYSYPIHIDEWRHISQGVRIIEDESIKLNVFNLEVGFHVFLAEFFLLTGMDPVLDYKFLPAVFGCISAFILFAYVYRITGRFLAGLFSMLFFIGLKSNIFILGLWFFVALTMTFPLLYLVFHSLGEGLKRGSFPLLFSAAVLLLALSLIHPSVASFTYMSIALYLTLIILYAITVVVLYLMLKRESLREEFNQLMRFPVQRVCGVLSLFTIPFLSFLYFLKFLWRGSLTETLSYFIKDFMIFGQLLQVKELYRPLFLLDIYGFTGVFLASLGILYLIVRKKGLILVSGVLVALAMMTLYQLHGFTFLILYERVVYCALLCLAPLSGIGLCMLTYFIRDVFKRVGMGGLVPAVIALVLVSFIYLNVFSDYYFYEDKIYRLIDDDDYRAIKWLEVNRGRHNIVLARPRISDAIYPVSRNYVIAVTPSGRNIPTNVRDTEEFLMSGCEGRRRILEKYSVDYVLVRFKIKCTCLKEIYHEGKEYIYEVQVS